MTDAVVFPIGYVSIATGLSTHVLRAWERRYAAVSPCRSASGRRLYSQEDIDRLILLQRAVARGHSISQIAGLGVKKLAGLTGSSTRQKLELLSAAKLTSIPHTIDSCIQATARLDDSTLSGLLDRAEVQHGRKALIEAIIVPFMAEVGQRWRDGDMRISHEHLASCVVGRCLNGMLACNKGSSEHAPRLMIATPSGQNCHLGALAVAVIAGDHGWEPVCVGPDLPSAEIASACMTIDPAMIALSLTCHTNSQFIDTEMRRLGELLDGKYPFVVGGAASEAHRRSIENAGGSVCSSSDELIDRLH